MRLLAALLCAASLCAGDGTLSLEAFQSPPDAFRPIPFWAWTGDVHREQIHRQMRLMRDQRLTSVMLYPRFGLEVPYFSEEFMGLVRYTVDQARELGMKIWLYDEYTWPSGTSGKRIPREMPQYRSAALCAFEHWVAPLDARRQVDLILPPDTVAAFAVSPAGRIVKIAPAADGRLRWTAPPGAWRVQVFFEHRADDYVDTLNPEAIRHFIEITHEGYKKAVGQWFGSVIAGMFTDEPVMFHRAPARFGEYDVQAFPWTGRLPAEFRAQHGYDLLDRLPEVLAGGKVRRDLWATATRLYSEAYHRQLGEWCRRNGIAYTGHILVEEPHSLLMRMEGDYFANLQWMAVPGIDEVQNRPGFGGDYPVRKIPVWGTTSNAAAGEWVAPKMAQATAEWTGARRTLVESYAYGPPSITLNEMRRIVNWEAVLGINSFLIAVFPSSLRGSTISTGWLPALFYQQPWYRYYKEYSDYVARTSYLLSRGERVSRVGVIYPSASTWGDKDNAEMNGPMRELARLLLQSQTDFTFVFESGLERAKSRKFDVLWVPPLKSVEPALARYLKEFGGKLYFYGQRPEGFAGGEVIARGRLPQTADAGAVRAASPHAGRILVQQRKAGDATIAFLVNVSTERTEASVALPAAGRAEFWDAATGAIAPAGDAVKRVFEPGEGVFVVVRPGERAVVAQEATPTAIDLGGPWEFRAERANSLRLKDWKRTGEAVWEAQIQVEHLPAKLELSLSQDLVQRAWVNGTELSWEGTASRYLDDHNREFDVTRLIRRGGNTVRVEAVHDREFPFLFYGYLLGDFTVRDGRVEAPVRKLSGPWTAAGYPEYAGTGIYSRTIDGVEGRVLLELADVAMDAAEVHLNGAPVATRVWEPYRFDLTGKLKPGPNRLEIRVTNSMANLMFGPIPAGLIGGVRLLVQPEVRR